MTSTLTEYLESQEELMREAALALPHQFSRCTYSLGPLRQAVYLCLTCPESRGLCSACSIACHTNHEQVELFPKRKFRCDCPTSAIAHPCALNSACHPENTTNHYGQNFKAQFCRCGKPYDAKTERETMIQCLACEDWFHESCCNLRERPSSREPTPVPPAGLEEVSGTIREEVVDDGISSDASSSGLPPPLIGGEEYESFICSSCVLKSPILRRYAGTFNSMMIVRNTPDEPWRRLNGSGAEQNNHIDVEGTPLPSGSGIKRPPSPSAIEEPEAKRLKGMLDSTPSLKQTCLAPPQDPLACEILSNVDADSNTSLGSGDLFLLEGFRSRWCRCLTCLSSLEAEPYLLHDEETYEPPEDPDSGLSLEELGLRALERIPRDRAIDGIHAFNEMKDDLIKFLRPFAQGGRVVDESDVREFFASLNDAAKNGPK